jgi:DNA-binding NarL/FixJ family response regulator
MSINVLVADDSDVMLTAMRRILEEEPRIRIAGEARTFAATIQMIADAKPQVLLLDLHMPEKRDFTPDFVRSQLGSVGHVIAVSFSNDRESQTLAEMYGAIRLLDKMKLYTDLVPAILECCLDANRARRSVASV